MEAPALLRLGCMRRHACVSVDSGLCRVQADVSFRTHGPRARAASQQLGRRVRLTYACSVAMGQGHVPLSGTQIRLSGLGRAIERFFAQHSDVLNVRTCQCVHVDAHTTQWDLVLGSVPHRLSCPIHMSWSLVWASPDAGVAAALRAPHLPRRLEQAHTQLLRRILSDLIVPAADQMNGAYAAHLRSVTPWLEHMSASLESMQRHVVHAPWDTSAILPALVRADQAVHPPSGFALQWPRAERSPSLVSDDLPRAWAQLARRS
ncbi:hypothetical protein MCAP1_001258 [Malassezia caprae]|uniref:Uncharacterized protein n=1 Tax=Malassezia caprae TaxID=1381934 RepID=A0AAF0IW05_9BASI|nr:hypothetical protein MCAP1_001258 [Malassezia caprae]